MSDKSRPSAEAAIAELLSIMARLRDPDGGCPWDLKQDFDSIVPYTVEEAFEVAEAVARRDYPELKEELGDLLLQVVFHSQMAREQGLFDFSDVVAVLNDKMVRRIVLKVKKKNNIDKFTKDLEKAGFRILDITED